MSSTALSSEMNSFDPAARIRDILREYLAGSRLFHHFSDIAVVNAESAQSNQRSVVNEIVDLIVSTEDKETRDVCLKQLISSVLQEYNDTSLVQQQQQPSASSASLGQGVEIEELVRNILLALNQRDSQHFPLKFLCDALVSITDFKLGPGTHLDGIKAVRKFLPNLDYKGVRDLLKAILDKMLFLPTSLTPCQRENLMEIEELVLEIVDRERNHLPAYFVMNELYRLTQSAQPHRCFTVWKLAESFSGVLSSFRPLSDLVIVIGRPFMIPIAGHGGFINNSSWKLDQMLRLTTKGYLPYCQEYLSPQKYLLYQLFRQPRGRELVNGYLLGRHQLFEAGERPRVSPLGEFVVMLVLETMMDAERGRKDAQNKAYEWLYIINTLVFSILNQGLRFQTVVQELKRHLKVLPYRKARDDLMWVLLQYVSGAMQKFTVEDCCAVLELYKLLYTGKEEFTTSHHEPDFVRKMSPTCLWVHLTKRLSVLTGKDDYTPLPIPATIHQQMRFLEDALSKRDTRQDNDFLSAVLYNAFSTKNEVLEKQLMPSLTAQWESQESFQLPLGGHAAKMFRPLPLQLLDALTIHFRMHLMTSFKSLLLRPEPVLLPSPAAVESFVRLVVASEPDFGLKNLLTQILPDAVRSKRNDMFHLCCEIVSYRVPVCAIPFFIRIHTVLMIYHALNGPQIHPQLFWLLENTFIRQLLWLQSGDCFSLLGRLFANIQGGGPEQAPGNQRRAQVMTFPSEECSRVSILTYARAIRVLGSDVSAEYVNRLGVYNWPSSTLKLFPPSLSSIFPPQGISQHVEERKLMEQHAEDEYIKWRTLGSEESLIDYFTRPEASPVFLRLLWRVIKDGNIVPDLAYRILEAMPPKLVVMNIYKLVDFLVEHYFSQNIDINTSKDVLGVLDEMIWRYWFFPFERFILAVVMMHYEENEARGALFLVHLLLQQSMDFTNRIKYLTANMPNNPWLCNDGFEVLAEYYKKFQLKYWQCSGLPVYFGHIGHRFIPVSDLVLQKVIEIPQAADSLFDPILDKLAPIYKFHPQPALFLCSTLYLCEGPLSEKPERRRQLVLKINEALEGCRPPAWLLTDTLRNGLRAEGGVEWEPSPEYYDELVKKVTEGMDHPLDPPSWAEPDWRFAEFQNPASQALHAVLVELMILPVNQGTVSASLVKLFTDSGWSGAKRKNTIKHLNSLAIILTALLPVYHSAVYAETEEAVVCEGLRLAGIEGCLYSFETSSNLMQESRPLRVLALMHAFWHHAPIGLLAKLPEFFRERIVPLVETEVQLMFALRLVVPFLQRLYAERIKCVMEVAKDIYEVLLRVDQNSEKLELEATYSDLLYHLKYMFVGDGIKAHIDRIIPQFRPSLQEKLKFISHQQQPAEASSVLSVTEASSVASVSSVIN